MEVREKIEKDSRRGHSESTTTLAPGTLINDKYQILSVLGRGGMGTVYRVKQMFLGKEFALKLLDLHNLSDVSVRRFHQEARTAAQLRHPNLVEVHDFGMLDNVQPYLVMDLIDGPSLAQLLKKRTTLPVDYAVKLCIQIAFGLLYAHEQGVVHRDIKPGNIIVLNHGQTVTEGSIKIVDFGIAKLMQSEEGEIQELTKTGEIFGSPIYMSPEQCKGTAIDRRSDIYSLGCVMFECLTGSPPFVAENAMSTMMMRLSQDVQTLKQGSLGREFPPLLESIVQKMLAVDPSDRYQELGALINDLARLEKNEHQDVTFNLPAAKPVSKKKSALGLPALLLLIVISCGFMHVVDRFLLLQKPAEQDKSPAPTPAKSLLDEQRPIPAKPPLIADAAADPDPAAGTDIPTVTPIGDGKQILHFPIHVGQIYIDNKAQQALGDIELPPGSLVSLRLKLFRTSGENLFANLVDVKFDCIQFPENGMVSDATIAGLKDVKHIQEVILNGTAIESLKPFYDAPFLTIFKVADTNVPASEILKLKRLHDLTAFDFGAVDDASLVLKRLSKEKLAGLTYKGSHVGKKAQNSGLTSDSLDQLVKLKNLIDLSIGNCSDFDNDRLKKLVSLKNLHKLGIRDCNVNGDSLSIFQSFEGLKFLKISTDGWSDKQFHDLKVQMAKKHCLVEQQSAKSQDQKAMADFINIMGK